MEDTAKNDADKNWLTKKSLLRFTSFKDCVKRINELWDALDIYPENPDAVRDVEFWSQHGRFGEAVKKICDERFAKRPGAGLIPHNVLCTAFIFVRRCDATVSQDIFKSMLNFAIEDVYGAGPSRLRDETGNLEKIALHMHDTCIFSNGRSIDPDGFCPDLTLALKTCIDTAAAHGGFLAEADYASFFLQPLPRLFIGMGANVDEALQKVKSEANFEVMDVSEAMAEARKKLEGGQRLLATVKTLSAVWEKGAVAGPSAVSVNHVSEPHDLKKSLDGSGPGRAVGG